MVRIALLPAIIWRFRLGDQRVAMLIYLAAMATDALDGLIARTLDQITPLGKLLDPLADKLTLLTLLALFVLDGQISSRLLQVFLAKELILIAGSTVALRYGVVVSALPVGKLTTVVFVLSMLFRFLAYRRIADILLWISVLLSIGALAWYAVVLIEKLHLSQASL